MIAQVSDLDQQSDEGANCHPACQTLLEQASIPSSAILALWDEDTFWSCSHHLCTFSWSFCCQSCLSHIASQLWSLLIVRWGVLPLLFVCALSFLGWALALRELTLDLTKHPSVALVRLLLYSVLFLCPYVGRLKSSRLHHHLSSSWLRVREIRLFLLTNATFWRAFLLTTCC